MKYHSNCRPSHLDQYRQYSLIRTSNPLSMNICNLFSSSFPSTNVCGCTFPRELSTLPMYNVCTAYSHTRTYCWDFTLHFVDKVRTVGRRIPVCPVTLSRGPDTDHRSLNTSDSVCWADFRPTDCFWVMSEWSAGTSWGSATDKLENSAFYQELTRYGL